MNNDERRVLDRKYRLPVKIIKLIEKITLW